MNDDLTLKEMAACLGVSIIAALMITALVAAVRIWIFN